MKRLLALLLAISMIVLSLAACGDEKTDVVENTDSTATQDPNLPAIPEGIDISGEFNILVSGNMERNDFDADESATTTVDVAIYRRNEAIKQAYGVTILNDDITKFNSAPATGSGTGFSAIYNDYMAGNARYDAAMVGTYDVATLAYNGLLWDLNSLPYIDLTKGYWDQKANEDLAVGGKMFYTTGDISIVDNIYTHALLFNKNIIDDYGLDDPYELVRNDQWTLEKLTSLVKQVGQDVDQNGVYNEKDMYGLLTFKDPTLAIMAGAGEQVATINDDGEIELTFYNERVVNLYDQFEDLLFDQAHVFNYQYDNATGNQASQSVWDTNRDSIFNENRAAFYFNPLSVVERHRDSEVDFGILPYPKFDATQEEYGHNVSAYHTQFLCIPVMSKNAATSGAVVELLAYYGQQYLTPAYYEKTLYGQYVRDEESTEMLDIIFATRVFDVGIYYSIGTYNTELGNICFSRNSIATIYETHRNEAESKIKSLNDSFAKLSY
ncbi:MAG: extracellular solute-binding protein [Clostridia bacterium]|nr:extracellular solute-binding protein [Clostridia bacterium]